MSKKERERQVLIGLVEHYIKTGKPVGSNTLKGEGFENLSAATIRNYFANMENEGFLQQQHSSGGRLPTEAAFRLYAEEALKKCMQNTHSVSTPTPLLPDSDTRSLAYQLQKFADAVSNITQCAAFLSSPRFDQDIITDLRLVSIDSERCLCVVVTDFGLVQTEMIHVSEKLSNLTVKRIENYFQSRITGQPLTTPLDFQEEELAIKIYNEIMVRHLVSYTNFTSENLYTTGFSQMLNAPELHDIKNLTSSLALFEDLQTLRHIVQSTSKHEKVRLWIGRDLNINNGCCSVITVPYRIHQQTVGTLGILGPLRMPYKEHISTLLNAADEISNWLTRTVFKFRITYREPSYPTYPSLPNNVHAKPAINQSVHLLEHKTSKNNKKNSTSLKGARRHG